MLTTLVDHSLCLTVVPHLLVIALLRSIHLFSLLWTVSTGRSNRSNRFHSHTTRGSHTAIPLEETDTAIDATAANDTAAAVATTTNFTVPDFSIVISNPSPEHLSEEEGAQQSTRNRVSHLAV